MSYPYRLVGKQPVQWGKLKAFLPVFGNTMMECILPQIVLSMPQTVRISIGRLMGSSGIRLRVNPPLKSFQQEEATPKRQPYLRTEVRFSPYFHRQD